MAMAKQLKRSDELGLIVLEDSEKNIKVSRDNIGVYRIVKTYPSIGGEESARVEFKDKGLYIGVNVSMRDYLSGEKETHKQFYVIKKDASIRQPEKARRNAEIVHGEGYVAGEYEQDKNELAERASVKHIHKIIEGHFQEKKIYRAILDELNKIKEFENIGTLLHEFHEHAEPDFHKRMEREGDIIEITEEDLYGDSTKKPKK